MDRDELRSGSGSVFKFQTIGATLEGVVTYRAATWEDKAFDDGIQSQLPISVRTDDGDDYMVYVRRGSKMAAALGDALEAAGLRKLEVGQRIKLRFESEENTGKPSPLKHYRAKVTPAPAGQAAPAADEPF